MSLNKKDEIYDLVVDGLINARYRFGQRILVKELAADTGVSRQPIMTALGRLASDGFVRIVPQVGCQVVDPDRNAIADFYLMFQRMEGLLTELAAERHTERELRELVGLQKQIVRFEEGRGDVAQEYAGLNRSFHQVIHTMAHSPLLDEKQRSNFNMSDFFINQTVGFGSFMTDAAKEHEDIIEAIAGRSTARARHMAEAHINGIAAAVLSGIASPEAAAQPGRPRSGLGAIASS